MNGGSSRAMGLRHPMGAQERVDGSGDHWEIPYPNMTPRAPTISSEGG